MRSEFQKIIDLWSKNETMDEVVKTLFYRVRDIPYGAIDSRDFLEVYKQNKGTCSGKHELLKGLYQTLGIPVRDFIIMHNFNALPITFPEHVQKIMIENTIIDPHNFIKIKRNNKWITIDATWDIGLKKVGFPVNEQWNGFENLDVSVVKGGKIYETTKPMELKKKLIANLPEDVQKSRKLFLKELTKWLAVVRE